MLGSKNFPYLTLPGGRRVRDYSALTPEALAPEPEAEEVEPEEKKPKAKKPEAEADE